MLGKLSQFFKEIKTRKEARLAAQIDFCDGCGQVCDTTCQIEGIYNHHKTTLGYYR